MTPSDQEAAGGPAAITTEMNDSQHPIPSARFARSARGAVMALLFAVLVAGCAQQLAVQDEFFSTGNATVAKADAEILQVVRRHAAMQAAQHGCLAPPRPPAPGPDLGSPAAFEALAEVCASTVARPGAVSAYGTALRAYEQWVRGAAPALPGVSATSGSTISSH